MMPAGVAVRFAGRRIRLGGRAARQAGRPSRRAACACFPLSVRCGVSRAPACPAPRRRWWDRRTPGSATSADRLVSAVAVTDPHHPLFGQRLAVLSLACARGPRFVAAALPDGRRRLIRRAATDLERPTLTEPSVPRVSARTLLPLARHIRGLVAASSAEFVDAGPSSPSCTSAPAPCAAASAMVGAPGPVATTTGPGDCPPAATPPRGGAPC